MNQGQYLVCKRPSKDSSFYAVTSSEKTTFICPVKDRVLVGSLFQPHRLDVELDQRDTADLIERASVFWPDVKDYILKGITAELLFRYF